MDNNPSLQKTTSIVQLEDFAKAAEDAALAAGKHIRAALERRASAGLQVNDKAKGATAKVDLVTEIDLQAEEIIMPTLRKKFPGHKFVGEESAFLTGIENLTDAPTWFIDPLDGTINFLHGYPFVCVSIGLYIDKLPAVGVIFNPFLEELYTAWRGGGAYLNGRRLSISSNKDIKDAMLATTLGASRDRSYLNRLLYRLRALLLLKLQAFRISGSTAQNIAHVASGRLDLYYDECGFGGPWDVGALVLIEEAGGVIRSIDGGPFELKMGQGDIMCGNERLVNQVLDVVRAADREAMMKRKIEEAWAWGRSSLVILLAGGLVAAIALTVGKPKGGR